MYVYVRKEVSSEQRNNLSLTKHACTSSIYFFFLHPIFESLDSSIIYENFESCNHQATYEAFHDSKLA